MIDGLRVTDERFMFPEKQLARGRFENFGYIFKFGFNGAVGTTEAAVWDEGGAYAYLASAQALTLSSDNANDTSAGTGLQTVQIYGLDANYAEITEVVTLNGQTAVTTANSYLRIFRMQGQTAGSGGTNEGVIYAGTGTVTAGVPANVFARISEGEGQTLMAVYTLPARTYGMLYNFNASSFGNANANATIRLMVREPGGVFRTQDKLVLTRGALTIPHKFPVPMSPRSDMEVRAFSSTGTIDVSASFEMMLSSEE